MSIKYSKRGQNEQKISERTRSTPGSASGDQEALRAGLVRLFLWSGMANNFGDKKNNFVLKQILAARFLVA